MEYKAAAGSGDPVLSHRVFFGGQRVGRPTVRRLPMPYLKNPPKTKNARILTNQGANLEGRDRKIRMIQFALSTEISLTWDTEKNIYRNMDTSKIYQTVAEK